MKGHLFSAGPPRHALAAAAVVGLSLAAATPAAAAPATPAAAGVQPAHPGGGKGGGGGSGGGGTSTTGLDVSYPQCGTTLPSTTAFAIVGVNGGLANDLNACLGPSASYPDYSASELYWASVAATGATGTSVAKVGLYVNTADPGNIYDGRPIADWPTSGSAASYGTCATTTVSSRGKTYTVGADSDACAWVYGYNKATQDATWLTTAAETINDQETTTSVADTASAYPWWLDVETANTWQSDTTMNVADLQGMIAGFQAAGAGSFGVYSTAAQWTTITGGTTEADTGLYGLADWIPGASSLTSAEANCALSSFTGGSVAITQWTATLDNDDACS